MKAIEVQDYNDTLIICIIVLSNITVVFIC